MSEQMESSTSTREPAPVVGDGWVLYFTDDEGTPFIHLCADRQGLADAVAEHWLGGYCTTDFGDDMAVGIADELIANGEFNAEDGTCYAKRITSPAPHVDELVEALKQVNMALIEYFQGHRNAVTEAAIEKAVSALAAIQARRQKGVES